jgi:cytochrome P450
MTPDRFGSPSELCEPFDYLGELRRDAPVFYSEALQAYFVTRFDAVQKVLSDPGTFSSSPAASPVSMALHATEYLHIYEEAGACAPLPTLLLTDGAVHRRYRKAIEAAFSPAAVRRFEGSIRAIADSLIDTFIDKGRVDLNAEYCLKLPSLVVCDLVGMPRESADQLKIWADTSGRLTGSALESETERQRLHRDRAQMHLYFERLIERYRAEPGDNLLSDLIRLMPEDGVAFDKRELVSILSTLNVGGNETTTGGLGNLFLATLREPQAQQTLRDEPATLDRFIEEALRLDSPVATTPRWVTMETTLLGVNLPKGSRIFISLLSANRDDGRFAGAAQLNPKRPGLRSHVAFGAGAHYCAGAMLARSEMKISMERVLARMEDLRIDSQSSPVRHRDKLIFRSLLALPITFRRRADARAPAN